MRFILYTVLALLSVLPAAQAADSPIDQLRGYFQSVDSLKGRFSQRTLDDSGAVVDQSSGDFLIARPDRFDWVYEKPFKQRIVADGRWLYVYDVELSQVTVRPLDKVLGVGPAVLLSGDYPALQESFDIEEGDDGWVRLKPKKGDWDFQSARLRMRDGVPVAVEVNDGMGQSTRLSLTDLEKNVTVAKGRFDFSIPDGVDVIAPDRFKGR
ncbi:MAG TPA: outer membrane lipoprotein chaperone LolA [Gammaproteobacteria bacterium]|nr:outer membrane lipoprotein chaperone LolA [Gammaproteobacteria bacterium]